MGGRKKNQTKTTRGKERGEKVSAAVTDIVADGKEDSTEPRGSPKGKKEAAKRKRGGSLRTYHSRQCIDLVVAGHWVSSSCPSGVGLAFPGECDRGETNSAGLGEKEKTRNL